jgi:hypothetical protein
MSADFSGNGNAASIYSANWTTGRFGNALSFNGNNSYVSAGTAGLPGMNQPKTISFWIYLINKPKSVQSMLSIAGRALKTSLKYGYKNSQTGVLDGDMWMVIAKIPSLRAWHHLAYVFDGSQNRLYVDGVLAGASTVAPSAGSAASFQMGRWVKGSEYFAGRIDDVRVYSRALDPDDILAAMNTPVRPGGTASTSETLLSPDRIVLQPAAQTAGNPAVDVQLEQQSYRQGETVSTSAFWISNPSDQSRDVELKTWIALPGLSPISLGGLNAEEMLTLPPGFSRDYGATSVLKIASNAPTGTAEADARLLDAVTGGPLAEDINPFAITAGKMGRWRTTSLAAYRESPHITLESHVADSRPQYTIVNKGAASAAVEVKVWLEAAGVSPAAVFTAGEDGTFVLPAGAVLTLNPLASMQVPPGTYVVKSRVLDAASGDVICEDRTGAIF